MPNRLRRPFTTVSAAVLIGAVSAGPATAQDGHSLSLSGPTSGTAGQAMTLTASGTVPDDVFLQRYVNVYAIARSVVPTCPATYQGALQVKDGSTAEGSDTVAVVVPVDGTFSVPIAYTPSRAGTFILCAYLHELSETFTVAQHDVTVSGGGDGGGGGGEVARPAALRKPQVKRSGSKLTCQKGRWSGAPTSFAYHWVVDGKVKTGATKRRLRVTRAVRGTRVRCGVTATNAAGSQTVRSAAKRVPSR